MAENDIPINADKRLFAHDLVNFVFRSKPEAYYYDVSSEHRDLIHESFCEVMETAVEFIEETLEEEIKTVYGRFQQENRHSPEVYIRFSKEITKKCFSRGFDPDMFLKSSVYIAMLAGKFYDDGIKDAPELAFTLILNSFQDYNMLNGGWDSLYLIARKIQSVSLHLPSPSPSSDSPEHAHNFLVPDYALSKWPAKEGSPEEVIDIDANERQVNEPNFENIPENRENEGYANVEADLLLSDESNSNFDQMPCRDSSCAKFDNEGDNDCKMVSLSADESNLEKSSETPRSDDKTSDHTLAEDAMVGPDIPNSVSSIVVFSREEILKFPPNKGEEYCSQNGHDLAEASSESLNKKAKLCQMDRKDEIR